MKQVVIKLSNAQFLNLCKNYSIESRNVIEISYEHEQHTYTKVIALPSKNVAHYRTINYDADLKDKNDTIISRFNHVEDISEKEYDKGKSNAASFDIRYTLSAKANDASWELFIKASALYEAPVVDMNEVFAEHVREMQEMTVSNADLATFHEWRLVATWKGEGPNIDQESYDKLVGAVVKERQRLPPDVFRLVQAYQKPARNTRELLLENTIDHEKFNIILKKLHIADVEIIKRIIVEHPGIDNNVVDHYETVLGKKPTDKSTRTLYSRRTIYSGNVVDIGVIINDVKTSAFDKPMVSSTDNIHFQQVVIKTIDNWEFILIAEKVINASDDESFKNSIELLKKEAKTPNGIHSFLTDYYIYAKWLGATVPDVEELINANNFMRSISEYSNIIGRLCVLLGLKKGKTLKEITNAPISIDRNNYAEIYPPVDYYITEKTEGIHALVYIVKNDCYLITNTIVKLPFKQQGDAHSTHLFEGELIYKKKTGTVDGGIPDVTEDNIRDYKLGLFDVLLYKSENYTVLPTNERLAKLDDATAIVKSVVDAYSKEFVHTIGMMQGNELTDVSDLVKGELKKAFDAIWNKERDHEIDGIIIQTAYKPYYDMKIWKWKPEDKISVDFLIKECPKQLAGKLPYESKKNKKLYWLFCGISRSQFIKLNKKLPPYYTEIFPSYDEAQVDATTDKGRDLDRGRKHDKHSTDKNKRDRRGIKGGRDTVITNANYFPIHFSPSNLPLSYLYWATKEEEAMVAGMVSDQHSTGTAPLDGFIGEFVYKRDGNADSEGTGEWRLLRIRRDREVDLQAGNYYGNNYTTAELTWESILNPVLYKDLYDFDSSGSYFRENKLDVYRAQTGYNSFVKGALISKYCKNAKWIIDMAGGRGADLGRYIDAGVKHATFVDIDRDALTTLVSRKLSYKKKEVTDITTIHSDLNDASTTYDKIDNMRRELGLPDKVDAVVCNFAIQYLMSNIKNFCDILSKIIKPGGYFVCTALDGQRIIDLIKTEGVEYDDSLIIEEDGSTKYQLKRKFKSDVLTESGQIIGVKLPFSRGELYDEELVNFIYLVKTFNDAGFELEKFGEFTPERVKVDFKIDLPHIAKDMTIGDRTWVSLYSYMVVKKTKE